MDFFASILGVAVVAVMAAGEAAHPQVVELRAGELTLVLGNEADHGAGRAGYIGLWSLTSMRQSTNAFFPRYAGWIVRRNRATLSRLSEREGEIQHIEPDGRPTINQTFRIVPPYYFDCTFSRSVPSGPVSFGCASYMNGPDDPGIYFLDPQLLWQRHYDPVHGNAASVWPDRLPLPVLTKRPNAPYRHGTSSFADSVSAWRYHPEYALFYGRFKQMVLVHMFPPQCKLIPYMSPSGGGAQADGRKNPAWDWRVTLPAASVQGEVRFTLRAVYKEFVSDTDVLKEYRRWTAACK